MGSCCFENIKRQEGVIDVNNNKHNEDDAVVIKPIYINKYLNAMTILCLLEHIAMR